MGFPKLGVPTIMENQMEKKMENEMETGFILLDTFSFAPYLWQLSSAEFFGSRTPQGGASVVFLCHSPRGGQMVSKLTNSARAAAVMMSIISIIIIIIICCSYQNVYHNLSLVGLLPLLVLPCCMNHCQLFSPHIEPQTDTNKSF